MTTSVSNLNMENQNISNSENIESTDSFKASQTISNTKDPSGLLSTTTNFEGLINSFVIHKTNQNVSATENIESNDSSRASPTMSNMTGPSELSTTINFEGLIDSFIIHKTNPNVLTSENIESSDPSRKSPTIPNMTDLSELPSTTTNCEGSIDSLIIHKKNPNVLTSENIESNDLSKASPTMFKSLTNKLRECRSLEHIPNLNKSFGENIGLDELDNIELNELFNDKCLIPGNCYLSDPQHFINDARNWDIVLHQREHENQSMKIFNLQNQNKVLTEKLIDFQTLIDGLRAENFISDDVADILYTRCKFGFESGI